VLQALNNAAVMRLFVCDKIRLGQGALHRNLLVKAR
jgi:hypothetical protein